MAQDNQRAATRLVHELYRVCQGLSAFPGMGLIREELGAEVQSFPVGAYVVSYRAVEGGVEKPRVPHGARDPDNPLAGP